jgi:hypothetical protein
MQPPASPEDGKPFRPPHPLALALIQRLPKGAHVLDFASGSGRNSAALEKAALHAVRINDATATTKTPFASIAGPFAAAISTHGLLHGTTEIIAANLHAISELLAPSGVLYATFGSVHDARFGAGTRLDPETYAPADGDEAGVPHTFFTRETLTALLEPRFAIESLEEVSVDEIAGNWAHRGRPLAGAVHWFVVARSLRY